MKTKLTILMSLFLCFAFNAHAQTTIFTEDFSTASGQTPPTGWQNVQYYTIAAGTDFWRYDNPGARTPGGGFSGVFAIFDSDNYSNNGTLEDIGLVSDEFNTLGLEQVFITFDYAASAAPTAVARLFVEVFDGAVWREVEEYVDTTLNWGKDTLDVSKFIRNRCDAQVRFRWFCQSGGWFALDNIEVFSPTTRNTTNVQLAEMVTPRPDGCADPNAMLSIRVLNAGTNALTSIPMYANIFDGNSTQNYNFTLSSLDVCADTVVSFPTAISIAYDSLFDFTVYADLAGDQVRLNSDTTVFIGFKNLPVPLFYPDLDTSICGTSFFRDSLPLSGNQFANWYSNQTDSLPLFTGPKLELGMFNQDTVLFLETGFRQLFSAPNTSATTTSPGVAWGAPINSGYWIDVIAQTDIYLDSLDVRTRVSGTMDYEIYTTKGPYLSVINDANAWDLTYSGAQSVTAGARTKLYVGGIFIKAGDTLGIHFFDNSALLPEVYSGVPHIVDNSQIKTFSSHYMNGQLGALNTFQVLTAFGYNLNFYYRIECEGTFSKRTYRKPTVLLQTAINMSTPFNGYAEATRDVVPEGGTVAYEVPAPFGLTNNDFGTKWDLSALDFRTINGTSIPQSHYVLTNYPPSGTNNIKLTYNSPIGWADSTLILSSSVQDIDVAPFCDSPLIRRIFVAPLPKVNFNYTQACQRNTTSFQNLTTTSTGFSTYKWYFGDGDSSVLGFPSHIYTTFGSFNVRLVATTDLGFVRDTTITIQVLETPDVVFSVPNRCEGFAFAAQNNTVYTTGNYTSVWDLGDGNTNTNNQPTFSYAAPGTYLIRLVVTGDNGCKDSFSREATLFETPAASFMESANNVCASVVLNFENTSTLNIGKFGSTWRFGNQGVSNLVNPNFQFSGPGTYDVRLVVESEFGCRDTVNRSITILQSPTVDFTSAGFCSQSPVVFTNNTIVPSGTNVTYSWNFNNEANSSSENPSHLFTIPGNKSVSLLAILDNGCQATVTKTMTISPQANASFETVNQACDIVYFNNTTKLAAGTVNYSWNFGDGNVSNAKNPTHNYNASASQNYTARLIASINNACPDTATVQLAIAPNPVCDFTIAEEWVPGNRGFKFTPQNTSYSNYRWSFGDGQVSAETSPVYQYRKDGNFTARLTATNAEGCECSKTISNTVANLSTTSLSDGSTVNLFPNPSADFITLTYELNETLIDIHIVDFTGKTVKTVTFDNEQSVHVQITDLAPGVYFVKSGTTNGVIITRFVVSR